MLSFKEVRAYLAAQPGAAEDRPFGPQPLVFKVGGKMFALIADEDLPLRVSLKCDPDQAQFLRDSFPAIQPGYHLSKAHWNTVTLDGSIPPEGVFALIDESHRLVVKGLTRAARAQLGL